MPVLFWGPNTFPSADKKRNKKNKYQQTTKETMKKKQREKKKTKTKERMEHLGGQLPGHVVQLAGAVGAQQGHLELLLRAVSSVELSLESDFHVFKQKHPFFGG